MIGLIFTVYFPGPIWILFCVILLIVIIANVVGRKTELAPDEEIMNQEYNDTIKDSEDITFMS